MQTCNLAKMENIFIRLCAVKLRPLGRGGCQQLVDCDFAPLNFEKNGEKSYYITLKSTENDTTKMLWGNHLRDLGLKNGDFVHFDEKLEVIQGKAEKIAQKRNLGHSTGVKI